jgi:hypothetical protein
MDSSLKSLDAMRASIDRFTSMVVDPQRGQQTILQPLFNGHAGQAANPSGLNWCPQAGHVTKAGFIRSTPLVVGAD